MFKLVPNSPEFFGFIRMLRNNDLVKKGFIQQHEITPEEHDEHMRVYGSCYYICLMKGEGPVGYVGVLDGDIRVCVYPTYHRRGVGTFMLQEFFRQHPDCYPDCKIKVDNAASLALFQSVGFKVKFYLLERE